MPFLLVTGSASNCLECSEKGKSMDRCPRYLSFDCSVIDMVARADVVS